MPKVYSLELYYKFIHSSIINLLSTAVGWLVPLPKFEVHLEPKNVTFIWK